MALTTCPDCSHMVSDLAVACPQCARPVATFPKPDDAASRPAVESPPGSGPEQAAQPIIEGWVGEMRKARELPARSKVCMRCDADVAVDTFRRKVGSGYLCADCLDEEEIGLELRRQLVSRALVAASVIAIAGALTAGVMQMSPVIFAPHAKTQK